MYFHCPCRTERELACSTSTARAVFDVPSKAGSTFSLSGAAPPDSGRSTSAANDAVKSTWEIRASETAGLTRAGQRTTNGTRVPPSKLLYFPPRNGAAGAWSPSFSTASSRYPSSSTGPLSLVNRTSVFRASLRRSSVDRISPTDQSSCAIASPRGPIDVAPTNRGCGTRGTCGSCGAKNRKKGFARCCSMKAVALRVKTSAVSSSFHSAALPPVI